MDENTVALTCPKVELKKSINRCCDLTDPTDECTEENWELPINGHLFNDSVKWTNNKVGFNLELCVPRSEYYQMVVSPELTSQGAERHLLADLFQGPLTPLCFLP